MTWPTGLAFGLASDSPNPVKRSGVHAKSLQSCLTLCDPMDCSPLGSSVLGILQARILEGVAIPFSRATEIDKWINTLHVGIFVCGDITEP